MLLRDTFCARVPGNNCKYT